MRCGCQPSGGRLGRSSSLPDTIEAIDPPRLCSPAIPRIGNSIPAMFTSPPRSIRSRRQASDSRPGTPLSSIRSSPASPGLNPLSASNVSLSGRRSAAWGAPTGSGGLPSSRLRTSMRQSRTGTPHKPTELTRHLGDSMRTEEEESTRTTGEGQRLFLKTERYAVSLVDRMPDTIRDLCKRMRIDSTCRVYGRALLKRICV